MLQPSRWFSGVGRSKLRYRFSRNIKSWMGVHATHWFVPGCSAFDGWERIEKVPPEVRAEQSGMPELALRLPSQTCFFSLARNSSKLSLFGGTTLGRAAGFLCMAGGLQAHGVRFCAAGGLSVRRRFRKHRRWLRLFQETPLVRQAEVPACGE